MGKIAVLYGVLVIALFMPMIYALNVVPNKDSSTFLHEGLVSEVNRLANGQWKASLDSGRFFRNATMTQIKKTMGVHSLSNAELLPRTFTKEENEMAVPESFDAADKWPQCPTIREIRDQSACGSCWAVAAVGAMSDRYCTVANVSSVRLSTSSLMSCCTICGMGCHGGIPVMAWLWWSWFGIASESCQPYPFAPCSHHSANGTYPACPSDIYDTPACNKTCGTSQDVTLYYGVLPYSVSGVEAYQKELMTNGPFEVAFTVYSDFILYKEGVYSHVTGESLGGHAVRIVGWGTLDGVPYWKIANSWNSDWGCDGYFYIKRGVNECGIEKSGVAGLPRAPRKAAMQSMKSHHKHHH